ncbi:YidH family protein [Bacillus alkalicellulosilyticus]|uniref:YidH family protein n=1 Tax=Alkalihalobacterium alkalicellulosilyticum TaxID=1912214 RepID=UPI000996F5B0|nr:DUF202 domain-containing protein [Bacillus alkalicellulosilyticus]
MEKGTTVESKYIQQHLANERTYLAWIRTSIALIGIGFLVASLHFNTTMTEVLSDTIAIVFCTFTFCVGVATIVISTIQYYRNRKTINEQTFYSSNLLIILMSSVMIMAFIFCLVYIFYV